jgi:gas vesicle protein
MANHGRETALAFLLGVVAGGVTAILLAPDRGSETRRRLREGARDLYRKGEEMAGEAKGTVEERAHSLADAARHRVDQLSSAARSQAAAVKGAVAEGRDAYKRELSRTDGE